MRWGASPQPFSHHHGSDPLRRSFPRPALVDTDAGSTGNGRWLRWGGRLNPQPTHVLAREHIPPPPRGRSFHDSCGRDHRPNTHHLELNQSLTPWESRRRDPSDSLPSKDKNTFTIRRQVSLRCSPHNRCTNKNKSHREPTICSAEQTDQERRDCHQQSNG